MNTYVDAMAIVPIARYEDRYSRDIGKWMVNAANAARLFYGNAHSPGNQSSEFWMGDPQHSIAYEGLRHNWLPPHLLKPGESTELYAAGDPLTYGWGPLTDFGIYGSAFTGVLGSIIKTTNVEKILQLDLLATDFYRDTAHRTFLYYNPHATDQSVAIDLGNDAPMDLYDAVSNRFLTRSAVGPTFFNVPKENAVMLVLIPSGGTETRVGRQLMVDDVVVDYNATLLPDNLIRNPDVDAPQLGSATAPSFWIRSTNATWTDDVALSPTHSLELIDNSASRSEEWRTHATAIPEGEDRTLNLRWYWSYDVQPGAEFRARLRLSNEPVTGVGLTGSVIEFDFTVSGANADFKIFETSLSIADAIRSFDLTFITGGALGAMGRLYIDDISTALVTPIPLSGDYNDDGIVDAADYVVWRKNDGTQDGYDNWRTNFGKTSASGQVLPSTAPFSAAVPEPATSILLALAFAMKFSCRRQPRRNLIEMPISGADKTMLRKQQPF